MTQETHAEALKRFNDLYHDKHRNFVYNSHELLCLANHQAELIEALRDALEAARAVWVHNDEVTNSVALEKVEQALLLLDKPWRG